MRSSVQDLLILNQLGVSSKPPRSPKLVMSIGLFLSSGWMKVNIDGAANGAPYPGGYVDVFRSSRGFCKKFFMFLFLAWILFKLLRLSFGQLLFP